MSGGPNSCSGEIFRGFLYVRLTGRFLEAAVKCTDAANQNCVNHSYDSREQLGAVEDVRDAVTRSGGPRGRCGGGGNQELRCRCACRGFARAAIMWLELQQSFDGLACGIEVPPSAHTHAAKCRKGTAALHNSVASAVRYLHKCGGFFCAPREGSGSSAWRLK